MLVLLLARYLERSIGQELCMSYSKRPLQPLRFDLALRLGLFYTLTVYRILSIIKQYPLTLYNHQYELTPISSQSVIIALIGTLINAMPPRAI